MRIPFRVPTQDSHPFDVVGLGENSVDQLVVLAEYPTSNTKQRLQRFARQPGGQIATALTACARLGLKGRYLGRFGDDEYGRTARESLTVEGVDTSSAVTIPGATNQFSIILVDGRTGERTVLWDRHPALTIEPADVSAEAVTSGRALMLDCVDTAAATHAARLARDAGIPTILDVGQTRPGVLYILQLVVSIFAAQYFTVALYCL